MLVVDIFSLLFLLRIITRLCVREIFQLSSKELLSRPPLSKEFLQVWPPTPAMNVLFVIIKIYARNDN